MESNGKLVLIDAFNHIYRGFYAIRDLTNSRGEPTNALYAMAAFLLRIDRDLPHEFGAVVYDKGAPRKRLEALPEYKATRAPTPDALRTQLPGIREWIDAAGWAAVEMEGQEADDLIAAIVAARNENEAMILSSDKDLAQLVGPGVSMMLPAKKSGLVRLDPEGVEAKFGVPPEALCDYLALVGDTSDNIPGIAGVGPKTAAALLREHGTIDGILENLDTVKRPSLREKLRDGRGVLQRNRELVSLDTTLPPDWAGMDAIRRREPDWEKMLDIARNNGFKSLIPTLEKSRVAARSPSLF